MSYKIIGAVMIIAGCGALGILIAAGKIREENYLRNLISIFDYMISDLRYRLTPLPELCRYASREKKCGASAFFQNLADELESQIAPDVSCCVSASISKTPRIPSSAEKILYSMGTTLGRFDLDGQIEALQASKLECLRILSQLENNKAERLRNYQTLGLCTGAALAILFI